MDKKLLRVRETPTVAIPLKHGGDELLFCIGKFAIAEYSDDRVEHMGAECYEHVCEYCEDGAKYVPPPDRAQVERDRVVAYLRARANAPHPIERGIPSLSPAGKGLLLLMADQIERGEHLKQNFEQGEVTNDAE